MSIQSQSVTIPPSYEIHCPLCKEPIKLVEGKGRCERCNVYVNFSTVKEQEINITQSFE